MTCKSEQDILHGIPGHSSPVKVAILLEPELFSTALIRPMRE